MGRCKELGSVGMFFRTMETGRSLGDPYFFPIYQEAARLGLPVCIHLGRAIPNSPSALQGNLGSVSSAFMAIVQGRIPEKFPGLKTGFIEFGSLWVPDTLHGMHRRGQMKYRGPVSSLLGAGRTDPQLFKDYGMLPSGDNLRVNILPRIKKEEREKVRGWVKYYASQGTRHFQSGETEMTQ